MGTQVEVSHRAAAIPDVSGLVLSLAPIYRPGLLGSSPNGSRLKNGVRNGSDAWIKAPHRVGQASSNDSDQGPE